MSKLCSHIVHQSSTSYRFVRWLQVQSAPQEDLRVQLQELIPEQQERLKKLNSEYEKVSVGDFTVDMVIGNELVQKYIAGTWTIWLHLCHHSQGHK